MFQKKKKTDLVSNYYYNFASQVLTLIAPFITAPYLARILHESGNGQIAFVNSIIVYFEYLAQFGFYIYGVREIAKCGEDQEARSKTFLEIMALKLVFTLVSELLLLALIFGGAFPAGYELLLLTGSIQVVAAAIDLRFYYFGIENFKAVTTRTTIFRLLLIVMVFVFIHDSTHVWRYVFGYAVSILLCNLVTFVPVVRQIDWRQLRRISPLRHLVPTFFIFLPTIAATIMNTLDSTMIGFIGKDADFENGCYSAAVQIINMLVIFVTVDAQVLAPRNALDFKEERYDVLKRHLEFAFQYVWELAFPLAAFILTSATLVTSLYYGQGYRTTPLFMRLLAVRLFTQGIFTLLSNQYFIGVGKEKLCSVVNSLALVMNVALNYVLILRMNALGACIATCVTEMAMAAALWISFIREKRFWDTGTMLLSARKPLLASLAAAAGMLAMQKLFGRGLLALVAVIAAGPAIYALVLWLLKDAFFLHYRKALNPFRRKKASK